MSVNTDTNKILMDCSTVTSFDFTFKIFKETDLVVSLVDNETQVITSTLALHTDYEVSISRIADGGTLTLEARLRALLRPERQDPPRLHGRRKKQEGHRLFRAIRPRLSGKDNRRPPATRRKQGRVIATCAKHPPTENERLEP